MEAIERRAEIERRKYARRKDGEEEIRTDRGRERVSRELRVQRLRENNVGRGGKEREERDGQRKRGKFFQRRKSSTEPQRQIPERKFPKYFPPSDFFSLPLFPSLCTSRSISSSLSDGRVLVCSALFAAPANPTSFLPRSFSRAPHRFLCRPRFFSITFSFPFCSSVCFVRYFLAAITSHRARKKSLRSELKIIFFF